MKREIRRKVRERKHRMRKRNQKKKMRIRKKKTKREWAKAHGLLHLYPKSILLKIKKKIVFIVKKVHIFHSVTITLNILINNMK